MFGINLFSIFLAALSLDESPAALKSTTAWDTNGPYGGPVRYGLAIDPNTPTTIYAASSGGVFRTTDGGGTWTLSSNGITEMFEIKSVAVDPTNPSIVYAGNSDSQFSLFRSTDGGATWTSRSTNLSAGTVNAIAIEPANPSTIYLGSPVGIWKSTDGSATWVNLTNGIGQREVVRLAIDRSSPSTIYAMTTLAGVFKSTNSGASWTAVNAGFVVGGNNTITLGPGLGGLSVDPTTPSRVYAANYVSTNGGGSWTAISTLDGAITGHAFSGSTIFASSQLGGVYKSTDSGQTWAKFGTGLPVGSVWSVAIDPKNAQSVYATTDSGIYKSTNGGASWIAVNKGVSNTDVSAVVVDPFAPADVFAGTYSNGIFRSSDSGVTWVSVHAGTAATTRIMGMAVDPQTPATVYAANWFGGVLKSTDRGATWVSVAIAGNNLVSIAVDPVSPSTLYVGTIAGGVFKSTNRGATFTVAATGLPRRDDNAAAFGTIAGVAVSPKDQSVWAWVQTGDASFTASISRDGGATWTSSYPGWNPTLANTGPALLDFLTHTVGLKNVSANFVNKQYGGPPFCLPITQVIADPFDSTLGYASGGCGVGRAKFANGQLTAMPVPARLPTYLYANALAITPTGTDLYVGMQWGGVYKFTLDSAPRVVEYYLASRDHYFITADPIEQAAVDSGAAGPFFRTGGMFKAGGTTPVCRFFGNTNINPATGAFYGPTSHFYTADANECAGLKAQYVANIKSWSFESNDFLTTPAPAGACPANTAPIYRAYNNAFIRGEDSNHRYTASLATYQAQVAKGWLGEGIVMCAPK